MGATTFYLLEQEKRLREAKKAAHAQKRSGTGNKKRYPKG
ncbi:hypothetical protein CHCC14688_0832 [Bacillus licheniformis]|nr:hypothetical protein CHCC14688_0832 [Bacillus licheniformis]